MIVIAFDSQDIRNTCEEENVAIKKFGIEIGNSLKARLADLMASNSMADYPFGLPNALSLNPLTFEINVRLTFNLVFCVAGTNFTDLNNIDWTKIKRIKLTKINNGDESGK